MAVCLGKLARRAASRAAGCVAVAWAECSRPEFQYDSLSSPSAIRILSLEPRSDDHLIHCSLDEVDLDTNPTFEALSYTWAVDHSVGEPTSGTKRTIVCNERKMQIMENLFHALEQLQESEMVGEPIWIDAICINQSNETEKSAQVKMMARIFETATRVIVWLGRESRVTRALLPLELMSGFVRKFLPKAQPRLTYELDSRLHRLMKADYTTGYELRDARVNFNNSIKIVLLLMSASRILRRGWFGRVWTLQEAILAKEVIFLLGSDRINLDELLGLTRALMRFGKTSKYVDAALSQSGSRMRRVDFVNETRKNRSGDASCTLEKAVMETRNRKAGDLRDKVFAVMSLCAIEELNENAILTVDYRKSVQEVFRDCAIALLESKNTGLFLLSLVGQIRHGSPVKKVFSSSSIKSWMPATGFVPNLPSWVPDLSAPVRPFPLREVSEIQYSAATNLNPCSEISGGTILSIRAAVLGKIMVVGDYLSSRVRHRPLWKFLHVPCHLNATTYRPTREPMVSAFWRTLVAGATHASYGDDRRVRLDDYCFWSWLEVMAWEALIVREYQMRKDILQKEEREKEHEEEKEMEKSTNLLSPKSLLEGFRLLKGLRREILADPLYPVCGAIIGVRFLRGKMISRVHLAITKGANVHKRINAIHQFLCHFDSPQYCGLRSKIEGSSERRSATLQPFNDIGRISSATEKGRDLFDSVFKVLYADRRIFATANGYMGTAPWTVQEGDFVMLVAGAYVPYVFRPAGEGAWKLIGEAYCHGAMLREDPAMDGLNFEMIRVI